MLDSERERRRRGRCTLIVRMPIAAAGLRLMPRSSRNTHSLRRHAEQLAGDLVEPRLGLAAADLAALDHVVEAGHDRARSSRRRSVRRMLAADVVGEARRAVAGFDHPVERVHHLGADLAGQQRRARRRRGPGGRAPRSRSANASSNSVGVMSLRSSRAHALVCGSVALTDADEVERQAVPLLVVVERLERARQDDAAEVPEHCRDQVDVGAMAERTSGVTRSTRSDPDGIRPDGSAGRDPAGRALTWLTGRVMPHHVVVDGSNIATEGRSLPSLPQLNEAVMAFMAEHPDALITVVVDATFGHRIDAKEVKEFDEAIANNELVAPPAGAVGRGDAFVLSIANKVECDHPDQRLLPGVPRPVRLAVRRRSSHRRQARAAHRLGVRPRVPVRGPVSRSAMKGQAQESAAPNDPSAVAGKAASA